MKYFYLLGHCPDLSEAEYLSVAGGVEGFDYERLGDFLISDTLIDVNLTGSLVMCGEIISTSQKPSELIESVEEYLSQNKIREIGLNINQIPKNQLYEVAKNYCKRVNIINVLPNFGHWKSTNNWLITIFANKTLYLIRLKSYSDQGFWNTLDSSIPCLDMSRGIINLKLGRSLLNLSKSQNIWDPFVGQGRIPIAGIDLKQKFISSDMDETVMKDLEKNYKFANHFWTRQRFNKIVTEKVANIETPFVCDVTTFDNSENLNLADFSIVTEGFLGKNFKSQPEERDVMMQSKFVSEMWVKFFENIKDSPIKEVVGCLPFYPQFDIPNYDFLSKLDGFDQVELLPNQKFIEYSRDRTFVGHLIFKVNKKS
jgi:hypothetical protein